MKPALPTWMRSLATARRVAKRFDQTIFDDDEDDTNLDAAIAKYMSLAKSIFKRGSVELYRALSLDFDGMNVFLNVDCLGGSWAWTRSGADVYAEGSARGTITVVITARVSTKDIAWAEGFENYLRHPGESEVALLRNRRVLLTGIDDQRLTPPIKANTGNAGEYWSDECAGGKRLAIPMRTAPARRVGDFFARKNPSDEYYQSEFWAWLATMGRPKSVDYDAWEVKTRLPRSKLIALWNFPDSQGGFPSQPPVTGGESARLFSSDGYEVRVFVEGWSDSCLGNRDPSTAPALGANVIRRWWEKIGSRAGWRVDIDEPYDDETGLTVLVISRKRRASKKR